MYYIVVAASTPAVFTFKPSLNVIGLFLGFGVQVGFLVQHELGVLVGIGLKLRDALFLMFMRQVIHARDGKAQRLAEARAEVLDEFAF